MQITANGISLEVEIYGPQDGTPLMLIRGLGSQLIHWPAELHEGLAARGYRVVLFDNRDVGLSQRCPAPAATGDADEILNLVKSGAPLPSAYTLSDMAQDVTGLMDALDIETAHIFGISMGGAVAQVVAIEQANRLRSATMVMTSARPLLQDPSGAILPTLLSRPVSKQLYIKSWLWEHSHHGSPGYPMPEADIRAEAETAWARGVDADGINRQLLAVLETKDRREELKQIALPCQVIHGIDDALIPVQLGREIADLIPNCPFHGIKGMGHIITPDLAPQIVDLLDSFIRQSDK